MDMMDIYVKKDNRQSVPILLVSLFGFGVATIYAMNTNNPELGLFGGGGTIATAIASLGYILENESYDKIAPAKGLDLDIKTVDGIHTLYLKERIANP
ncbi:MAG: hypothetical protein U9P44_02440 [archaeon]|nr:hypothetical protein [archaeon]